MSEFQRKFDKAVWKIVSGIRRGRVMSYGQVARAAGFPRHARMVSKAMGRSADPLPWYRVIRSDRTLAFEVGSKSYNKQRSLLEKEGVSFVGGKIVPKGTDEDKSLDELLWGPREQ
jgi:methylated-DNA-protein-cysteine methyltransferase-like protein